MAVTELDMRGRGICCVSVVLCYRTVIRGPVHEDDATHPVWLVGRDHGDHSAVVQCKWPDIATSLYDTSSLDN
jgi:hypothetical protein